MMFRAARRPVPALAALLLLSLSACAAQPDPEPEQAPPAATSEAPAPEATEEPPAEPSTLIVGAKGIAVESEEGEQLATAEFDAGAAAVREALTLAFGEPSLVRDEDGSLCGGPHDVNLWADGAVLLADYVSPASDFVPPLVLTVTSAVQSEVQIETVDGVRIGDPAASWYRTFPSNRTLSEGGTYGLVVFDVVEGHLDIYGGGDPYGAIGAVDDAGMLALVKTPTSFGGFTC